MIFSRAPYRVSLFGGGSDYEKWFSQHGGAFLSLAINKYCYAIIKDDMNFNNHKYRVSWRIVEEVQKVEEIKQPVVREVLKFMEHYEPIEVIYLGDLPSQSGVGSSSSFAVAMLKALAKMTSTAMGKYEVAKAAYHIEYERLKENVGVQDSIASSFGGMNFVEIKKDGNFLVQPVLLQAEVEEALLDRMLLVYTKEQRRSSDIAGTKLAMMEEKKDSFKAIQNMAYQSKKLLITESLDELGVLLDEAWQIKSRISGQINTQKAEQLYHLGKENGMLGFKLLGAGGGGFALLYFKEGMKQSFKEKLPKDTNYVDFIIDKVGCSIIT